MLDTGSETISSNLKNKFMICLFLYSDAFPTTGSVFLLADCNGK